MYFIGMITMHDETHSHISAKQSNVLVEQGTWKYPYIYDYAISTEHFHTEKQATVANDSLVLTEAIKVQSSHVTHA